MSYVKSPTWILMYIAQRPRVHACWKYFNTLRSLMKILLLLHFNILDCTRCNEIYISVCHTQKHASNENIIWISLINCLQWCSKNRQHLWQLIPSPKKIYLKEKKYCWILFLNEPGNLKSVKSVFCTRQLLQISLNIF